MNWLIEHVPFVLLFAGGVGLVYAAWRLLGVKGALGALGLIGTVLLYREGRKDGRQSQVAKEQADADHAINEAADARVAAAVRDANPERLRDSDGFRRD